MDPEALKEIEELQAEEDLAGVLEDAERVEAAPLEAEDIYSQKPISIKFGGLTLPDFSKYIIDRINLSVEARASGGFDDKVRAGRLQYKGLLPEKTEPYEGSSNFNVPMSQPIADTVHANFMGTFFGGTKWFVGTAPTAAQIADAEAKENSMQFILEHKLGFKSVADILIHRADIDNSTICRVAWEKKYVKKRVLELSPEGKNIERTQMVLDRNDAIIEPISVLDFGFYPADAVQKSQRIMEFHRYWESRDGLVRGAATGKYDKKAVDALILSPSQANRHDEERGGNESDIEASGISVHDTVSDSDKPYECFECLVHYDDDRDGMDEYLIVNICSQGAGVNSEYDSGPATLLRGVLYPFSHGESWYTEFSPFIDPDEPYPSSLMERLEDPQKEANAIQNMRTDRAIQENNAPYVVHSSLKRDIGKKKIAPGMTFYSDTPKDAIFPVALGTGSQRTPDEVRFVMALGEDIAGVNATKMGRATGDATARENEMASQGVNVKFDAQLGRLSRSFERVVQQVAHLYAQYMPSEMEYAVKIDENTWDYRTITQEQMKTKMGFRMQATSSLANPEFRAYIGEKLIILSQQSPLISGDMKRVFEVTRYYLENSAGIKDYERYIGTAEDATLLQEKMDASAGQKDEKISITERRDEVLSLARALKDGELTVEEYFMAAKTAAIAKQILGPVPDGAKYGDATDNSAGYEEGGEA